MGSALCHCMNWSIGHGAWGMGRKRRTETGGGRLENGKPKTGERRNLDFRFYRISSADSRWENLSLQYCPPTSVICVLNALLSGDLLILAKYVSSSYGSDRVRNLKRFQIEECGFALKSAETKIRPNDILKFSNHQIISLFVLRFPSSVSLLRFPCPKPPAPSPLLQALCPKPHHSDLSETPESELIVRHN